jgi:hypothetical protein
MIVFPTRCVLRHNFCSWPRLFLPEGRLSLPIRATGCSKLQFVQSPSVLFNGYLTARHVGSTRLSPYAHFSSCIWLQLILRTLFSKMYLFLLFTFCIIIIFLLKFRRLHLFERNGFNAGTLQMGQVKSIPVWLEIWYHTSVAATQQHKEGQGRTRAD